MHKGFLPHCLTGGASALGARRVCPLRSFVDVASMSGLLPNALAAIFGLPESIKFMTLHESHRVKMVALLKDIRPDFQVPPNPRFVIEDERQSPSSNPIYLFGSGMAAITPLTWMMFACNLM